jgi:acyl-CoA hydrolase
MIASAALSASTTRILSASRKQLQPINKIQQRTLLIRKGAPKVCTPEEAVTHIKSGDRVYVHGVAATPIPLLKALEKRAPELKNVEFCHLHLEKANP